MAPRLRRDGPCDALRTYAVTQVPPARAGMDPGCLQPVRRRSKLPRSRGGWAIDDALNSEAEASPLLRWDGPKYSGNTDLDVNRPFLAAADLAGQSSIAAPLTLAAFA